MARLTMARTMRLLAWATLFLGSLALPAGPLSGPLGTASADEADDKALAALEKGFETKSQAEEIAAIRAAAKVNSEAVAKAIGERALGSKRQAVQIEGMKALGGMKNPEAVKQLHRAYKTHQAAKKDPVFFVALLTEMGRQGDPSSVAYLTNQPFKFSTLETSRARIYGLGNIRTRESVEGLIHGLALAGTGARGVFGAHTDRLLPDFQTALTVLTGSDQGRDRTLWQNWWRANKKTFEMDPELPVIPVGLEKRWEGFWDAQYPVEQPVHGFPTFEWVMNPSDEQVKTAVDALEAARKSKNAAQKLAAIYTHMLIVDAKVVKAIHKVAKKSGRSVIEAAIDALGWMPTKAALKELQGIYKRHRDLYKFENYFSRMLKAIGRHNDESSLKLLLDKPFKGLTMASGRARILGVARIRSKKAVEDLMKAMQLAGSDGRRALVPGTAAQPFMGAIRLALVVLTGVDKRENKLAWQKWWRENKRTFQVNPKRPKLSESMRESWEEYWEEPYLQ